MKKLKPKRIDWYLLGICRVFVLCLLVPSLIDTNNYMQHPDIRITHDNCHLVKMKEAIEKMGMGISNLSIFSRLLCRMSGFHLSSIQHCRPLVRLYPATFEVVDANTTFDTRHCLCNCHHLY